MLGPKLENSSRLKSNRGSMTNLTILSDVKNNQCGCGGKFKEKDSFEGVLYPVCEACKEPPPFFRIRASLKHENGTKRPVLIRYTQDGERLNSRISCLWFFKTVDREISSGTFNFEKYDSKLKRESYLFKNVIKQYQKDSELRYRNRELTKYTINNKIKYSNLLLDFFGNTDVSKINTLMIEEYRNSYTDKFSNRDLSLGELRTILNYARSKEMIHHVPFFKVPATKKRKSFPKLADARDKALPTIVNTTLKEALRTMCDYGLRPCEVRAVQCEQIDLVNNRILIDRHFSENELVMGRKGHKEGKLAALVRRITPELKAFILSKPQPLSPKNFLFSVSGGQPLGLSTLNRAWRRAEKNAGLEHEQMYGLRAGAITEVLRIGGLVKAKNFAGHSNVLITASRYDSSSDEVDEFIGKR